jgi:hypothetical protein
MEVLNTFHLLYPGLNRALEHGHVSPRKGVVAADASLCVAFQKASDITMLATSNSSPNGRRKFASELSSVGQLSPRDVAAEGLVIHGRRGKKKSRHHFRRPRCQCGITGYAWRPHPTSRAPCSHRVGEGERAGTPHQTDVHMLS